jgi:hypothetical protein
MKQTIILILFALVATPCYGQRRPPVKKEPARAPAKTVATVKTEDGRTVLLKDDGTYEILPGPATPPALAKVNLDIETGLVFTDGSVVPAPRTTFYILNKSATELADAAGLQPRAEFGQTTSKEELFFNVLMYAILYEKEPEMVNAVTKVLKEATVTSFETDFAGKGKVSVPAGNYYLYGLFETRGSGRSSSSISCSWFVPVALSSDTHLILDNKNAQRCSGKR